MDFTKDPLEGVFYQWNKTRDDSWYDFWRGYPRSRCAEKGTAGT